MSDNAELTVYEQKRLNIERDTLAELRRANHPDWWHRASAVASVVALILSAIALAVVYRQGNQALERSADANAQAASDAYKNDQQARYGSVTELSLGVDLEIANHPEIASCFTDKRCDSQLSEVEERQAKALSFYILDFYQYLHTQMVNLGEVPDPKQFIERGDPGAEQSEDWVTWSETIISGIENSRMICSSLIEERDAYSSEFVSAVAAEGPRVCPGLAKALLKDGRAD